MPFEDFVYPPYGAPLIDAYDRLFESAFVVLHPFIRMPAESSWAATRQYPSDEQILASGTKCSWAYVAADTGIETCARLNQALLTSTGALIDYLRDYSARDRLQEFLQNDSVWMPTEGRFEPLLQKDILAAFEMKQGTGPFDHLVFVPEFPRIDPIQSLCLDDLKSGSLPFPSRGSLVAPDALFLFAVDWDSFFTLLYGPRDLIAEIANKRELEGFFAAPTTEHAWFNYSMGCATVTVAPSGWPGA